MSKTNNGVIKAKNANSDFGSRGWFMIIVGMLMYFCSAAVTSEGSNLLYPAYSEATGIGTAGLYSIATIASLCCIPLSVVMGLCLSKFGPRKAISASWLIGAVGLVITGFSHEVVAYTIGRVLINVASYGGITISFNGLVANWFPTKKDLVQGYATMGSNLATAFALIFLNLLINNLSIQKTYWVCGLVYLIIAIISYVGFRDNPEDVNRFPDNDKTMTREKAMELQAIGEEYKKTSPWTIKKLLMTKQTWQIAIGFGMILLITVGILSTFVTTMTIKGLELNTAIGMMTAAAVVALPCSYLWGYLGTKFGTKRASLLLYVVIFLCVISMMIPVKESAYVAVVLLGCFIGAGNNLTPSIIGSVYGRYDFAKALTVIIPIWNIVVAFATTVVGVPQSLTGSYMVSYVVLLVCALVGFILVATLDERCIGRIDLIETDEK
jgi:MFS family permease